MSLATRILVLIAMILLPIVGIDIVEGIDNRLLAERQLEEQAVDLARATALDVEHIFAGAHQLLAGLSQTNAVRKRDRTACAALLTQVRAELALYDFLALDDRDGAILCRNGAQQGGTLHGDPWQTATTIAARDFVVGTYGVSKSSGHSVVRVSYPVLAADGSVDGILVAGLDLRWLNGSIAALQSQPGMLITVADRNGAVIARAPGPEFVGTTLSEGWRALLDAPTAGNTTQAGVDNVVRIYGYAPAQMGPGSRILVTVGFDRALALAAIDGEMWRNTGFDLAVVTVAALIAWLYVRRFVKRPFRHLLTSVERWQAGDWTRHARMHSGIVEFDRLAAAFDAMAEAVAARQASLETMSQSLRKTGEHLARAQRVAATGSFEYDLVTGSVEWSDETYRIFGLTRDIGPIDHAKLQSMIVPEDRAKIDKSVALARAGQPSPKTEFCIRRPDGKIRTIYADVDTILDAAGTPVKLIGVSRDVTDLRDAERQRDTFEMQFYSSQKMEALGTLAGGIAHDLNNALVPVIAFSNALLKGAPDGTPEHRKLELIDDGAKRARGLVQRILTFGRKDEIDRRPLDLVQFAEHSLKLLRSTLPATITLAERFEPVPLILADEGQLNQVLMNLVTNAAYALGTQMGTITVEVAPDAGVGGKVRLSVIDTGCGMDEATRQRLFEPFFTTKPINEGTGLGLSVVHGIITKHDGAISVQSVIGKGTRFDVYLPVHQTVAGTHRDVA
jgi:PAS domain S-box-containing protein